MLRLMQTSVLMLLLAAQAGAGEVDRKYLPRKDKPLRLDLWLMEGGSVGSYRLKEVKAVEEGALPLPRFYFVYFYWDGEYLQIRPGGLRKDRWPKEAVAKNGWYLTGDYSTDPPRVIVTERATASSRWTFVGSGPWYLKNENGHGGKDAWVALQERGKRYSTSEEGDSSANIPTRYWDGTVVDAILTFDKDKAHPFRVADIEDEDGK
jgi:hypothetical protein